MTAGTHWPSRLTNGFDNRESSQGDDDQARLLTLSAALLFDNRESSQGDDDNGDPEHENSKFWFDNRESSQGTMTGAASKHNT